jgi:Ulp1 family protease
MSLNNIHIISDTESEDVSSDYGHTLPEEARRLEISVSKKIDFIESALSTNKDKMIRSMFAMMDDPDKVIIQIEDIPISIRHFATLKENGLLVDNVVDGYGKLINARYNNVYIPSCFFYSKLIMTNVCFADLYKWFDDVNILEKKSLLFFINQRFHWFLVEINNESKSVRFYDSLGYCGKVIRNTIFDFYIKFCKDVYNVVVDESQWTSHDINAALQNNGVDCGVFMLMNAEFIAEGVWGIQAFEQEDIMYFRMMIAFSLMQTEINYDI